MAEKRVTVAQYQALIDAVIALAEAGQIAIKRLQDEKIDSVRSTNYGTALRGFDYLAKFIEGTAGTVTTERSRAILEPILDELRQVAEDRAAYEKKGRGNNNRN